ncbi:hypothetical protein K503DRAFT_701850 [Rhizopogon vinicolor AM-OR11-026]|uniref:Uncharacterized protein n=1 Tax=Rhizopogon vinicolor AM-OR11-026 TaxID=1314800 RepID=A0A1B7MIZ5_9AGAM|nr:hypothetical protein K503DRAFT_701850 [Rhizopogon vinicolor AM-OR11-026]
MIFQFPESCIDQQTDILLTEMQDQLREICDEEGHRTYILVMCIYSTQHCQVTRPAVEHDENDHIAYKILVGEHFRLLCCAHEPDCQHI